MAKKIRHYITVFFIVLYKVIFSQFSGRQCRFEPTCSNYTKEAITEYGFLKGAYMAIKRVCKCNPFYKKGEAYLYDPVKKINETS